ncbi:retrotransposable element Tf2 [Tanacetum coccineum]
MSAQTRSGMPPLLDNGTIAALKDALFGLMREEMERFWQEKSNSQNVDPNGGVMLRQNNGEQRTMQFSRLAKVEFPKFDGADVRGWMFRCEEFFAIEQTADEGKIGLISIHLYDIALMWHRQYVRFMGNTLTWQMYRDVILKRFGLAYDGPLAEIKKLKQTGSVQQHIDAYDRLLCRVELQDEQAMSFFIAGLQSEIELVVRMFKPTGLAELHGLCKLQESQLNVVKQKGKMPLLPTPKYSYPSMITSLKPLALPAPNANWRNKQPTASSSPYRKQLTQKKIEDKRSKGLCFYCDQKYFPRHKCSGQVFLLEVIVDNKDQEGNSIELEECLEEEIVWEQEPVGEGIVNPQISLNAITGVYNYQTMRVMGYVKKSELHILVDSGSTHNFLNTKMARQLACNTKHTCPLQVSISGGRNLVSTTMCIDFTWSLQGESFTAPVMILPLGGCDMVLGIQWLSTLGDICCNFHQLKMSFKYNGKHMTLRGTNKSTMYWMIGKQSTRIQCNEMTLCVYPSAMLHVLNVDSSSKENKDAIELMVKEILDAEVIRHSQSSFASPIVMVKKKDGSWRMCIDYRQLNKHTIKDKFPIPIIEELIDELHGSVIFLKLDLTFGYHQIRMYEDDIAKTAFKTHDGHYEFLVIPFGLTNAPSKFQSLMNEVFRQFLRKFTLVFFDDILVYSPTEASHEEHLRTVLHTMRNHKLYAKKSKCVFGSNHVEYLGHIISDKGVATDPDKIEVMKNWTIPKSLKQLRGFLGLTGYYRRYKKGIENVVADALSRLSNSGEFLQMVATNLTTDVYQRIVEGWSTDDKLREIVQKLQSSNGTVKHYQWSAQQLLRKGKLKMRKEVKEWARTCTVCQRFKPELVPYPGLLQPLPIPKKVWTYISMDFVDGLPMSKAITVAQAFLDNVYKLHGLSKVIVSDKDIVFLTHPAHVTYTAGDSVNDSVDRSLMVREAAIQLLKFHLQRAQDRMKTMTDKKRTERVFGITDLVLLKLQPYRQSTLRQHKHHKLAPKYYGPFKIVAKVGEVAYKLELPADSQIHPVFHVSQLKKFRGTVSQVSSVLPHCDSNGVIAIEPIAVLDRRMAKRGNVAAVYVLIQWTNEGVDDATWELYDDIAVRFLTFDLNA